MPICEADPWRMQYFEGIPCPEDVRIPTEDADGWAWYPDYKWVYNKLALAESQNMVCGPHGLCPPRFPVFSKPTYNMRGMGVGSRVLASLEEYQRLQQPGHMWMPLLEGEQISSDVAIAGGEPRWWRHAIGHPLGLGMFDYWTVLSDSRGELEEYCGRWIRGHFAGYTGMINIETIGGKIIEAHLRFSDQWPDIYGPGWLEALIRLYAEGRWELDDSARRTGYSVVLFGAHGVEYKHPCATVVESILAMPTVTSVQITFHEDRPPGAHSMPPGGFRLSIVNCWDLEVGFAAREKLALSFWPTPALRVQRRTRRRSVP